ncbi:MAG: YciI family protein [Schlesneria sp.]
MNDYIFLMHNDGWDDGHSRDDQWAEYIAKLQQAGVFQGGSAIGDGICLSKAGTPPGITLHLSGFIRVQAESLSQAQELVHGNPVFEAGETVEIRELPKS